MTDAASAKPRVRVPARSRRIAVRSSAFDAGRYGRRSANWDVMPGSANHVLNGSLDTLRERSRAAIRNNPYATSLFGKYKVHVVGQGIRPRSAAKDEGFRKEANELFDIVCNECVAGDEVNFFGQQELCAGALFSDGEILVRERPRRPEDGLTVPIQFQTIEADQMDAAHNEVFRDGRKIVAGVEYDRIGRRVAYHIWRDPPGSSWLIQNKRIRVPADQVHHVKLPFRPGQTRGMPPLVHALITMRDIADYNDAELVRKKTAAMFTAFLATNPSVGDTTDPLEDGEVNDLTGEAPTQRDLDDFPVATLEPGTIQQLLPGEDIKFSEPSDVGSNYKVFNQWQARIMASSLGFLYEQMTGDWSDIEDRTYRAAFNEFKRMIRMHQHHVLVYQTLRRQWNAFLKTAIYSGVLTARDFVDDPNAYLACKWLSDSWEYIHPVQDVQADILRMRAGLTPRDDVIAETSSRSGEVVDAEIAEERRRADELGIILTSDAGHTSNAGGAQSFEEMVANQGDQDN